VKVIVDTCVWSMALRRGVPSAIPELAELRQLVDEARVQMVGAIRQEILSGIRVRSQFEALRDRLRGFPDLRLDGEDYELAWKMLKRQLEREAASPVEVDGYSFRQLFRVAGERGIVDDVEAWFEYRKKRNLTTNSYNEETARRVFAVIGSFPRDAGGLLAWLEARNAD